MSEHPHNFGTKPDFDNIPVELRDGKWCVWRAKPKANNKFDKVPYNGLSALSTAQPDTWLSFDQAVSLYRGGGFNGIGRLVERDGYVFIDIDDTHKLPDDIKALGATYCERSPSGAGLRLVYKTDELPDVDLTKPFELYAGNSSRFITLTGDVLRNADIAHTNGKMARMVERHADKAVDFDDPIAAMMKPDFSNDDLLEFLSYIDPDAGHDVWLTVMQGLHHHFDGGEDGMAMLDEWSQRSKDYDQREIRTRYRSFSADHANPVKATSIKALAKAGGYGKAESLADDFRVLDSEAPEQPKAVKPLLTWVTDEHQDADHTVHWTIENFIEQQALVNFYGPSGVGKSFLAIDFALCVATGTPWYGNRVKGGQVLYIAGEGHRGVNRRIYGWRMEHGMPDCSDMAITNRAINLTQSADRKLLVQHLADMPDLSLVVVDTFGRATAGINENSAEDVQPVIEFLAEVTRRFKCTVMVVHHTPKHTTAESAGSKNIKASMDVEMSLESADGGAVLTSRKTKEGPAFDDIGFKMISVELPPNYNDEYGSSTTTAVMRRDDSVTENRGVRLSPSGEAVMRSFLAVWDDMKVEKASTPVEIIQSMGFDAPSEGLWLSDVRDHFERSSPAETRKEKDRVSKAWRRGVDDCVAKDALICYNQVLMKL